MTPTRHHQQRRHRTCHYRYGCSYSRLGFVGWRMLMRQGTDDQTAKSAGTSAKVILTQEDLDAATKSLDEIDFTESAQPLNSKQTYKIPLPPIGITAMI